MNNKHTKNIDDEIDLLELFNVLFHGKWIIVFVTIFVSFLGIIYSLTLPNIYESKALLVPVESSSKISRSMQNFSGLANIGGINLSSRSAEDNSAQALKKFSSLSFFQTNILPKIFLPDLMAFKSWDSNLEINNYDESVFNVTSNTWVRKYSHPRKQVPSAQESFHVFLEHFNYSEDSKTGFINLSVKHQSPVIAKQWTDLIINEVNDFYRKKDKLASEKSVNYLNQQISMTGLSEIKQVIAQLLQEETQRLALIEANESYVFDYIDPPAVMEIKSEPNRGFICILFAIFGVFLGIFLVFVKSFIFRDRVS